jgi:hypothetical protein
MTVDLTRHIVLLHLQILEGDSTMLGSLLFIILRIMQEAMEWGARIIGLALLLRLFACKQDMV